MSLNVFSHDLSIKLADSFIVSLKWRETDTEYTVLKSCISFQPPVAKFKKEVQQIGNNSYAFLIPDWEVDDLTITLQEDTNQNIGKIVAQMLSYTFDFNDEKWFYKENNIYQLLIDVYDNNFNRIVYRYDYRYLKLVKYDNYQLDYESDNILQWSLSFAYMYSKELACNIDPNEHNVSLPQESEAPNSTTKDIAKEYSTPHQNPNTGNSDGNNSTGGASAEDAYAKALNAQKTKMEQDSKTEQAQTPAAEPKTNDQEIVLDNVDIKASEGQSKIKETAATNPVDLNKLSGDDRIDELAYRMMRGQLDNGKPRYDKTYKAGYTESERAAAQGIVNQKDWEGLKERHDARVANKDTHYSTAAETEVAKTDYTPTKDVAQSRSADTVSPASQSTGGQDAADAAAKARLTAEQRNKSQDVAVNTKHAEKKHETQKPKQQDTQVAKTEPKKNEEKKQPKQEATKPSSNKDVLNNGMTATEWGQMAAANDIKLNKKKSDKDSIYNQGKSMVGFATKLPAKNAVETEAQRRKDYETAYNDYMKSHGKAS